LTFPGATGSTPFIPKYRKKALYAELRKHLGEVFRDLAQRKECRIDEGGFKPL
jgi:putative transposase